MSVSRWRAFIPSTVLVLVLSCPAYAEKASKISPNQIQKMTYEVYAGGINAVTAKLDVAYIDSDRYSLVLSAFTKGFLGTLAPWSGTFETHGWLNKDGMGRPELHRSTAIWRDEEEVKEYSYDREGHFAGYSIKDPENDGKVKKPETKLVEGTIDVLTAALHAMQEVGENRTCGGESEIFDGKRRYKLIFKFEAYEDLKATRYNVYQGPSQRCSIEVSPIAGEWHSKPRGWMSIQEQGRQRGSLPTIWFAILKKGSPAVPIKIRVKSEYGGMFMHLVNYHNGQSTVTADIMNNQKKTVGQIKKDPDAKQDSVPAGKFQD